MKKKSDKENASKEEDKLKYPTKDDQIQFDLADEKKEYVNLDIRDENLDRIGNFLQKVHLRNHSVSSKETIHEVYRPEEEIIESESYLLSEEEELIFNDIQKAIAEHDIINLRNNLQFITKNVSAHNYSFEDLEDFIDGELDEKFVSNIEEDLLVNPNLRDDVRLYKEVNLAIVEKDIIQLRSDLAGICENESSHTRSIEDIENYLSNELEDASRESFEEEMLINAGLMKDVKICNEINEAIGERDVILLRKELNKIKDSEIRDDAQKRGVTAPRLNKTIWYAAASIILLIGLNVTFRENSLSNEQLYNDFYQPFQSNIGVSRSANLSEDNLVNRAIMRMNEKDYDSALLLFSDVLKNDRENVIGNFYTGSIQQIKGNYEAAIHSFNDVIRQGDNLFVEQSEWYIGLCYLNRNEREKAIKQFKKIVQQHGYYQKKSEDILEKLE